jgi:hypothetical protein
MDRVEKVHYKANMEGFLSSVGRKSLNKADLPILARFSCSKGKFCR